MGIAYCYRSGQIEFGRRVPDGALPIAKGPMRLLRQAVEARARHSYDGRVLLVPGLPEASDDDEAMKAAGRFSSFITKDSAGLLGFGERYAAA